jgi:cytochrome c-type biogenesis protein CcmH/NrfG
LIGFACLRDAHDPADDAELRLGRPSALVGAAALAAVGAFALLSLVSNTAATKADAAVRGGHWKSEARHARQVIRWAPWSSQGWQQLGEAQLAQRQVAAARRSFRKAAKKDPRDWSIWLELATAETGAARHKALAEARRLNPRSAEIAQFVQALKSL